jgi:RluA family pseudouridine synthase
MPVPILYQDDWLLAVNKPAGLATVPGGWEEKGAPALVKLLEADYGRLWIVHRLDKVTSGVVVFARTAEAHRTLSLLFESHAVVKTYHAIVCGAPQWDEHTARHPLRINVGHGHRTVVDHGKGKPAKTRFRVLERFAVPAPDRGYALLRAKPATGRTHQVRAHLAALGFPILADTLYGALPVGQDIISPLQRPALHANSLEFEFQGKSFSFTAPYPNDFAQALQKLRAG